MSLRGLGGLCEKHYFSIQKDFCLSQRSQRAQRKALFIFHVVLANFACSARNIVFPFKKIFVSRKDRKERKEKLLLFHESPRAWRALRETLFFHSKRFLFLAKIAKSAKKSFIYFPCSLGELCVLCEKYCFSIQKDFCFSQRSQRAQRKALFIFHVVLANFACSARNIIFPFKKDFLPLAKSAKSAKKSFYYFMSLRGLGGLCEKHCFSIQKDFCFSQRSQRAQRKALFIFHVVLANFAGSARNIVFPFKKIFVSRKDRKERKEKLYLFSM